MLPQRRPNGVDGLAKWTGQSGPAKPRKTTAPNDRPWADWTRAARADYENWQKPLETPGKVKLEQVICHLRDTDREIHQLQLNLLLAREDAFIPRPDTDRFGQTRVGNGPDAPLQLMAIEHRRWVHHLVTMIETGNAQEMTRSGLDLHTRECRFGRWYYGPGQHRFGHLAVFQDLEDTHARVHHLANELIELCLGGHQATARARKPELMAGQAQLLAGLDRLHGL